MRNFAIRSVAATGFVAVLVASSQVPSLAGPVVRPHSQLSSLMVHSPKRSLDSCVDLTGISQWTGTVTVPQSVGAAYTGGFTDTLQFDSTGTLSGTVTSALFPTGTPINGNLTCNHLTFGYIDGTGSGTLSSNAGVLSGSGSFTFDGINGSFEMSGQLEPTLTLVASALPVNSGPVTYTATLLGNSVAPTGSVTVADNTGGSCVISTFTSGVGTCQLTEDASQSPYTVTASYGGDSTWAPTSTSITNTAVVSNGSSVSTGSDQIVATANGGTAGVDSVSETQYGTNPVGNLADGNNYFDVQANVGNSFASVVINDCNQITTSSTLAWWDPNLNSNAGGWAAVIGDPGPTPVGTNPVCLTATLDSSSYPTVAELTGTVFATAPTHVISSPDAVTTTVGTPLNFHITTLGTPIPTLTESGALPAGLHFVDNGNGTASLSGTPSSSAQGGVYKLAVTASYGAGGTLGVVHQTITLLDFAPPVFVGPTTATTFIKATVTTNLRANGYPPAVLTENGALPSGVTFTTNYNGTATLSGSPLPGSAGRYPLTIHASNNDGGVATRSFTLVVPTVYVTAPFLPAATRGTSYSTRLSAGGGVGPYAWRATSALPRGLSLTRAGRVKGTPSRRLSAKIYQFEVKVTDATRPHHVIVTETVFITIK